MEPKFHKPKTEIWAGKKQKPVRSCFHAADGNVLWTKFNLMCLHTSCQEAIIRHSHGMKHHKAAMRCRLSMWEVKWKLLIPIKKTRINWCQNASNSWYHSKQWLSNLRLLEAALINRMTNDVLGESGHSPPTQGHSSPRLTVPPLLQNVLFLRLAITVPSLSWTSCFPAAGSRFFQQQQRTK